MNFQEQLVYSSAISTVRGSSIRETGNKAQYRPILPSFNNEGQLDENWDILHILVSQLREDI
jgi:hypothetical protein